MDFYQLKKEDIFSKLNSSLNGLSEHQVEERLQANGYNEIREKKENKFFKILLSQINNFVVFADIFGLKPVIALRFNRLGWFFINPKDMKDSGSNWVINEEIARKKGKRFAQFFG